MPSDLFKSFVLNTSERQLTNSDAFVPLTQVFNTLVYKRAGYMAVKELFDPLRMTRPQFALSITDRWTSDTVAESDVTRKRLFLG